MSIAKYIPPHLRAAAAVTAAKKAMEPPKPEDYQSQTLFPSLGGVKHKIGSNLMVEQPTLNFKQKVDELIEFEKKSELEKEALREAARALEGFVSLSLKIDHNFINKYNTTLARSVAIEKQREVGGYNVPPLPLSLMSDMDDEDYVVLSDDEDNSM